MKKQWLLSCITAIMVLAIVNDYATSHTNSNETGANGFYISGSLGGNYLQSQYASGIVTSNSYSSPTGNNLIDQSGGDKVKYKFGWNSNLNAGYKYDNWRSELSLAYLQNNVKSSNIATFHLNGSSSKVVTYMVNSYYDINLNSHKKMLNKIVPYISAGIGVATIATKLTAINGTLSDAQNTTFAYQGKIGTKYLINKYVNVYLEYTHLDTAKFDLTNQYEHVTENNPYLAKTVDSITAVQSYYMNNIFNVGISYTFNL